MLVRLQQPVDTIKLNDKTFVDNFRTPHCEKLHVVERYRLTDGESFSTPKSS
jgi:hypothetical protein